VNATTEQQNCTFCLGKVKKLPKKFVDRKKIYTFANETIKQQQNEETDKCMVVA